MARPGPQTMAKRQRELKKREKRLAKKAKMEQRKAEKAAGEGPEEEEFRLLGPDDPVANHEDPF